MAMAFSVRVTELCKITPPESPVESSLPLTFLDAFWFRFHPVERIFFYELPVIDSDLNSDSDILPRLKESLSLTLLHFLPFAGKLIWPSHSDKPFLHYSPGDGVSLTVAESDADYHSLSGDSVREIPDSHNYVPELNVTETEAATVAFQITVFRNGGGFCIGVSSHHAIFDGKSIVMFVKAWAHICKNDAGNTALLPELTPVLDRTLIHDPQGLDMEYFNDWKTMAELPGMDKNPRSLKLITMRPTTDTNFVRGTFKLSGEDITKIRQKALSQLVNKEDKSTQPNSKYLSTFVLSYAYVSITIIKAKALENNKKVILGFTADVRSRLDPPVPANYFGNCVFTNILQTEVECLIKEDGLAFAAEELRKLIKVLEKEGGFEEARKMTLEKFKKIDISTTEMIGVAGSPRFEVYGIDFGWGKPVKVEVTSIDRSTSISMAERRDGNGGVEIGVVLKKDEMVMFESLFLDGLKNL